MMAAITSAARRSKAQPTAEQLRLALRQIRRPHWPASDDAVLAHPVYGPCVRALARNLARAPFNGAARQAAPPAARQLPRLRFDARAAAANDRGDD